MRLTRNEWIKSTLRQKLWEKAALLRLAPATQAEIGKVRKQVLAIGPNINQAVHAMNAVNQPKSALDIARIAETFLQICAELRMVLWETRRMLASSIGGEIGYWRGALPQRCLIVMSIRRSPRGVCLEWWQSLISG